MERTARTLGAQGWALRSGAAEGADSAFVRGAAGFAAEIWLPWEGFCADRRTAGATYPVISTLPLRADAEAMARAHHPAWTRLSSGGRRLMTRNVTQVLGPDLATPSAFVLCWARSAVLDGALRVVDVPGGTGLAVRLAAGRAVPVFHLGLAAHRERVERFVAR